MVAVLAFSACAVCAVPAQPANERDFLPLFMDRREFNENQSWSMAPGSGHVAYSFRQARTATGGGARAEAAAPSYARNNWIAAVDSTGQPLELCSIGGNSWYPVWSPDGSMLAFYSDAAGSIQLWIHDPKRHACRKAAEQNVGGEPEGVLWAPDSRSVYASVPPSGGEESSRIRMFSARHPRPVSGNELLRIDLDSGQVKTVLKAQAAPALAAARVAPSGRWLSYVSPFSPSKERIFERELAVVSASDGQVRVRVEGLPVSSFESSELDYSWHPSRDLLVYVKDQRLWALDFAASGSPQPRQLAAQLGELSPVVHWFTRDGRALVVGTHPQDDQSWAEIRPKGMARVPLDGGPPLTFDIDANESRWRYLETLRADASTIWQPDGQSITLKLEEKSTGETAIVRFDWNTRRSRILWKGLAKLGPLAADRTHQSLVGIYESYGTPGDLARFSSDFSRREPLTRIDPRLRQLPLGVAETFETVVPMYDGSLAKTRTAVLLPPGRKRGDRLPAVVTGYPGVDLSTGAARYAGGDATFSIPNFVFTQHGYAVVLLNLPLGPEGQSGNVTQEMLDTALPQLQHAAQLGYVDLNRLAIEGLSGGGYATAAIITKTNLFRAAISLNGHYDLPGVCYGGAGFDGPVILNHWEVSTIRLGSHPWADLGRYLENSPYYLADKIATPVIVVAGGEDRGLVDTSNFFTGLRRLGKDAQLIIYSGEGHRFSDWSQENMLHMSRQALEFFDEHLAPAYASRADNTRSTSASVL